MGIAPEQGLELVRQYADKLSRTFGIHVQGSPPVLGYGEHGTAFDLGDMVLKLTDDRKEATAAAKLRDAPKDFAVHVEAVFELGTTRVYGVYQEKLQPLPAHARSSIERAMVQLDFREALEDGGNVHDFVISFEGTMRELQAGGEEREMGKMRSAYGVLERYGIFEIARGLESMGISFSDYKTNGKNDTGNLMMRDGKVVVIDLGNSKVAGGGKIDVVESNDFWRMNREMAWRARFFKLIS